MCADVGANGHQNRAGAQPVGREALLPEPGGFEGLVLVLIAVLSCDFPIADLCNQENLIRRELGEKSANLARWRRAVCGHQPAQALTEL